ncbi:hypothetical protein KSP39_PZI020196 [Platanthera zijinensis]|uniref:Uncharacterized protein n=1 Tax=Platanthera zijinensis TaxID=2320716 RepID=A0AAP0FX41_9ASPA
MVAYYTAHKLRLGWGYLFFVVVRRAQGLGLLRGLPTECNGTQRAKRKEPPEADIKDLTEESSQGAPKCT